MVENLEMPLLKCDSKTTAICFFKGEVQHLVPFVELSSLEDSNLSSLYNTLSHGGSLEYFDKLYTSCLEYLHPEAGRGSMYHVVSFCWTSDSIQGRQIQTFV